MHAQPLIHSVVQQTMVLVAHLATAGGVRAPLARVANQVFADLTAQLGAQGVTKTVIADMFGMALSTYHRRVKAASESQTDVGRSVWEAVFDFVREKEPVSATDIMSRFARDDTAVVASVLKDLTDSGAIYRSGRGRQSVYRAASPSDFAAVDADGRSVALRQIVRLAIVRRGPLTLAELSEEVGEPVAACAEWCESLLAAGLIEATEADGSRRFESARLDVPVGTSEGWEAAVLDHFQAVVSALCIKLRQGSARSSHSDAVGGATYTLDVWPGHPLEHEARTTLSRLRQSVNDLRDRIDQYNEHHPRAENSGDGEVTVYVGQFVKTQDAEMDRENSEE